jgi:branched-chain amino acid transport system permease protein
VGLVHRAVSRLPLSARLAFFVLLAATLPLWMNRGELFNYGIFTLLYILLGLGLNVVVGYAGLLDLGYVAFFGFGAYGYTFLASRHFDVHWEAEVVIPIVVVASAMLGLLLGLSSRRLLGDYLAIVTLFFLQIFITLLNNADRIDVPFRDAPVNFTRGPNGIASVDPLRVFGFEFTTLDQYLWLSLGVFVLVIGGLYALNESRTGRAWRALREDPLAAEAMGTPVKGLKLLAFSIGAAAAGLTGTIFAAQNGAVFPVDFDLVLLITLYAMVILGGAGSLPGVAIGAVAIWVSLEVLRTPSNASWIFYAALLVLTFIFFRWRGPLLLAALAGFGFLVRVAAEATWSDATGGRTEGEAALDRLLDDWVLVHSGSVQIDRLAFMALVAAALGLTLLRGLPRLLGFVPVLYLAVFVWQNVLVEQSAVARYVMLGAMLVGMMAARPQGLLGTTRVEIV